MSVPSKGASGKSLSWKGAGLVMLGLTAGLGAGLLFRPGKAAVPGGQGAGSPAKPRYQCPMHPQVMMDHEGDCPLCGMALVAMEGGGAPEGGGPSVEGHVAVSIDPERQQLIGLRTVKVVEGPVGGEFRTVGRVAVDETRVRKINVKVEGFVEKLFVDFVGKAVAKGQPLFSLYSPEFVSAQREYLLALRTQKALSQGSFQASGGELLEAARRRLQFWDVPAEAIEHLERTGETQRVLILRSPISGVVTAKSVVEGARISPADAPLEITDLGRVWVQADAYESELAHAKVGLAADFTLQALPGKVFHGRVAFIDPVVDPRTRTTRLRIEVPNPRGDLKPELFGEVVVKGPGRRGILVPIDAVLDAGIRKVAFAALGDGRFEPREVVAGATVGEQVEILSGLRAGEAVVVRANFLVDSESRLRAALAHLGAGPAAAPGAGAPAAPSPRP